MSPHPHWRTSCSDVSIIEEYDLDASTMDVLMTTIKRRMAPKVLKFRADLEVSCYGVEGVDAVKASYAHTTRTHFPVLFRSCLTAFGLHMFLVCAGGAEQG